jgi:hypothetical protein
MEIQDWKDGLGFNVLPYMLYSTGLTQWRNQFKAYGDIGLGGWTWI